MMDERLTRCCADVCQHEKIRLHLGDSWHPGGLEVTRHLAEKLAIGEGEHVLDLGCGVGTTSIFLARKFGAQIIGVDLSSQNATRARISAGATSDFVEFEVAHGGMLGFRDRAFDAIVSECVLSTFHKKEALLKEVFRVLKPGGRIGLSDVVVEGELPAELRSLPLGFICVADALGIDGYMDLLRGCGFEIAYRDDVQAAVLEFIEGMRKKLYVAELLSGLGKLKVEGEELSYLKKLIALAGMSVKDGKLSYTLITATRPRLV
jgi:ubiquinone/menaquinone biosynthesis C-methylase UbiE